MTAWLVVLGFAFMLALIWDDGPIDCYLIRKVNDMRQFPSEYRIDKKPTNGRWGSPKQLYQYQLYARKGGRTLHARVCEKQYRPLHFLMKELKMVYGIDEACYLTRRPVTQA